MLRELAVVILLAGTTSLSGQTPEKDLYAGWPQTWKDAYRRFENYNVACDFLLEILPPGQLDELLAEEHSGREYVSYYNKRCIAILRQAGPFQKKSDEDLFILWEFWSWHINNAIQNDTDSLTGLGGVLEKPKTPGVVH